MIEGEACVLWDSSSSLLGFVHVFDGIPSIIHWYKSMSLPECFWLLVRLDSFTVSPTDLEQGASSGASSLGKPLYIQLPWI